MKQSEQYMKSGKFFVSYLLVVQRGGYKKTDILWHAAITLIIPFKTALNNQGQFNFIKLGLSFSKTTASFIIEQQDPS
jgi:hypothetical protein